MKKIAIFVKDLGIGGIQRSIVNLLNNIDTKRYNIDLYVFSKKTASSSYNISKNVNVIYKKPQIFLTKILPFWTYYFIKNTEIQKEYDVSIDFGWTSSITAVNALRVKAKKYIYWVHSDYNVRHNDNKLHIKLKMNLQRSKFKFSKFGTIVGVSEGVLEFFKDNFPKKAKVVIPNYIDTKSIFKKSNENIIFSPNKAKVNVVCLCRLVFGKGIDLLLEDIPKIINERVDIHFYVIGDGKEKIHLEKIVKENNIENFVTFLGTKMNPFPYLKQMDVLVLNSRYEGQGMVLMEAKSLGIQTIFPKRLEKYNQGFAGSSDLVKDLISIKKTKKGRDDLSDYNNKITKSINKLLG